MVILPHNQILVDYKHGNENTLDAKQHPYNWDSDHDQFQHCIRHKSYKNSVIFYVTEIELDLLYWQLQ